MSADRLIDIIIPTWNNPQYLYPCVQSILGNKMTDDLFRVIVVNNGHPDSVKDMKDWPVTILQQDENKGWEGGLKAGLEISKSPFVVFMNDDTLIPVSSSSWLNRMVEHFADKNCAAVGPSSNVVMGPQNIFAQTPFSMFKANFFIGFCVMLRRSDLDAAGGVDDSHPFHGDDLDLSIRLRKLGKHIVIDKSIFVYHHGFKTGTRTHKDYWNSAAMTEKTNNHLIRKHGLKEFLFTLTGQPQENGVYWVKDDVEKDIVLKHLGEGTVLELGCGAGKTLERAVGVDMVPRGAAIPGLGDGKISVADITANVEDALPLEEKFDNVIARHVLEHCVDSVKTLKNWGKSVKDGGRLIIAVPDQDIRNTIPLNFQHCHAYTKEGLKNLMEALGWTTLAMEDAGNHISFVGVFEKQKPVFHFTTSSTVNGDFEVSCGK